MLLALPRNFGRLFSYAVLIVAVSLLASPLVAADDADVILVLDNSGSMRKNDPEFLLKRAVAKFVSDLGQSTRVGMVIFAQDVDYPVPLGELDVDSRAALKQALEKINYRGQLTNSPAAIERAIYELKSNGRADANKIIIFMTDGIVDTGDAEIDKDKTKWMREELSADAADSGIRMFALAFTENADFFLIQSLAKRTGGEYFRALTPQDLAGVFDDMHGKIAAAPEPAVVVVEQPTAPGNPGASAPPAGSCLATLIDEERLMMEEAAPDAGITAEQLCLEMMAPIEQQQQQQQPIVQHPPEMVEESDEQLGMILLLGFVALVLLILAGVVVWLLKRRGGAATSAAGGASAPIPDAFINDVNGVTGDPAVQLGAKPMVVGRVLGTDPAHMDYFVVDKGTIGRRHAIIQYRDYSFWLVDQGSVNGTFLNGQRIEGERPLKHGDRIKFHKYEFEFTMPDMDDGGHTVFADPNEATMVGDATVIGGTAAFAASEMAAAAAPQAEPPQPAEPQPIAFEELETAKPQQAITFDDLPEGDETAEGDIPVVEATHSRPVVIPALDDEEPPSEAEFDAEASAFFDEDDLGQTNAPMGMSDFDDSGFGEPEPAANPSPAGEDFSESETMTPGDVYADHDPMSQTSDISLDEFMRTDTFEASPVGYHGDDDDDDATLMPDQVGLPLVGEATGAPAIDDIFDITGEGTVPPVANNPDDPDDDDDGSEAPTEFRH